MKDFNANSSEGRKLDPDRYVIPNKNNMAGTIYSTQTKLEVALNLSGLNWSIRKSGWNDFEVECEWTDFTLEGEKEIVVSGVIVEERLDDLKEVLDDFGYQFSIELFDEKGVLIRTIMSKA